MSRALAAADVPWDKLLGPIFALIGVFIAAQVRRGSKALGAMKDNIDQVPELVRQVGALSVEVKAAHEEASVVGAKFTAFAEESSADRRALHASVAAVTEQQRVTQAVASAVGNVGTVLGEIVERLPPRQGPSHRNGDPPDVDWRERRR